MDDGGHNACPFAPVAFIDILHDLFPTLVLEVDVDVWRFIAIVGYEARKEQIVLHGIDRGNAQQEAHHAVGSRSPALT